MKRLEDMDPVSKSRQAIQNLVLIFSDPLILTSLRINGSRILIFREELRELQRKVSELLEFLQGHIVFTTNAFPDIQLDFFRNTKAITYLEENGDILNNIFQSKDIQYPISIFNVGQLSKTPVTVKNEAEFQKLKSQYDQLIQFNEKTIKMTPKNWPVALPNFSTHNGFPQLPVSDVNDFYQILGAYGEYIKRLEFIKKQWTFALRVLYTTLEETNVV